MNTTKDSLMTTVRDLGQSIMTDYRGKSMRSSRRKAKAIARLRDWVGAVLAAELADPHLNDSATGFLKWLDECPPDISNETGRAMGHYDLSFYVFLMLYIAKKIPGAPILNKDDWNIDMDETGFFTITITLDAPRVHGITDPDAPVPRFQLQLESLRSPKWRVRMA